MMRTILPSIIATLVTLSLVTGCQLSPLKRTESIQPLPKVVEEYPAVAPKRVEQASDPVTPAKTKAQIVAARKAKIEAARKEREQLAKQRKLEREAKRRKEEEAKARERTEKLAKARKSGEIVASLQQAIAEGELSKAEQLLKQYRAHEGERVLKQSQYQQFRQEIARLKQMDADLEMARAAEQYLQQLLKEAATLAQKGKREAARKKYGEVLLQSPGNAAAQQGLEQLSRVVKEKVVQPKKRDKKRVAKKVLGKKSAGWVVQVATYAAEGKKEAYALLATAKRAGFKAVFVKKQQIAGRTLYRVRVGVYADKEDAVRVKTALHQKMAAKGLNLSPRVMKQKAQ